MINRRVGGKEAPPKPYEDQQRPPLPYSSKNIPYRPSIKGTGQSTRNITTLTESLHLSPKPPRSKLSRHRKNNPSISENIAEQPPRGSIKTNSFKSGPLFSLTQSTIEHSKPMEVKDLTDTGLNIFSSSNFHKTAEEIENSPMRVKKSSHNIGDCTIRNSRLNTSKLSSNRSRTGLMLENVLPQKDYKNVNTSKGGMRETAGKRIMKNVKQKEASQFQNTGLFASINSKIREKNSNNTFEITLPLDRSGVSGALSDKSLSRSPSPSLLKSSIKETINYLGSRRNLRATSPKDQLSPRLDSGRKIPKPVKSSKPNKNLFSSPQANIKKNPSQLNVSSIKGFLKSPQKLGVQDTQMPRKTLHTVFGGPMASPQPSLPSDISPIRVSTPFSEEGSYLACFGDRAKKAQTHFKKMHEAKIEASEESDSKSPLDLKSRVVQVAPSSTSPQKTRKVAAQKIKLIGEMYQKRRYEKKTREKFQEGLNNSACIKANDSDSENHFSIDFQDANKSLEITDKILDVPKKELLIHEFNEGDTKEPSAKILEDDDSEATASAEKLFPTIVATNSVSKMMMNKVKEFFKGRDLPIEDYHSSIGHYDLLKCIGQGTFGKVHLGVQQITGCKVAVKAISKKLIALEDNGKKKLESEIAILKKTHKCSGTIDLWEMFESKDYCFLVTEYAAGGDLLEKLKKEGPLSEKQAKVIFGDLVESIESIHRQGICHRDLKLENILLTEAGRIKIADFGISKVQKKGEKLTDVCGTPASQAPEAISGSPYDGYGADVWGLGIALYHMIFGRIPFRAQSVEELHKKIQNEDLTFPSKRDVTPELKDLLRRLLQKDPQRRMRLAEAKVHLWLDALSRPPKSTSTDDVKTNMTAAIMTSMLGFPKRSLTEALRAPVFCHGTACYMAIRQKLLTI